MEQIIAAIIGAVGQIAAALVPKLFGKKKEGENSTLSGGTGPFSHGGIEAQLRNNERVKWLLNHKGFKHVAEAAVKNICRGTPCENVRDMETRTWQQVEAAYAKITESTFPMNAADQLFQQLLNERRKISYINAYERLLGNRPNPWLNIPHCREVLAVAQQSRPRVIGEVTVQLDALIVNQNGNQEPSEGFFTNRGFTRERWREIFGAWPVL